MAQPKRDLLLRGIIRRSTIRFPTWIEGILSAGITSSDRLIRRRQRLTNIVAFIAALNAVVHFVTNAIHDFDGLLIVNFYNVAIFLFCVFNHRLHRFGDLVAPVVLIVGIAIGHSFVVFAFGTSSDLHFYFTLAGFSLFLVGIEHIRIFLALYAIGLAAILLAFGFAAEFGFMLPEDLALRRSLSFEAAMNAYLMIGLLVWFALTALFRAEERSDALLASMLPARIVERLRTAPDQRIADRFEGCSVLFVDIAGFTSASRGIPPETVLAWLDRLFSRFDALAERHGIDKIKTVGDSYMAVGGLDGDARRGAIGAGLFAIESLEVVRDMEPLGGHALSARVGLHIGAITAGVIGEVRIAYDVWGETVNVASRLESHGEIGRIHVSADYRDQLHDRFRFEDRGEIEIRSLGTQHTWFLVADDAGPVSGL